MNAHLLLLVLLTGFFAGVWNQDARQNEAAAAMKQAQRPPVVQKSAMAMFTSRPAPVIANQTRPTPEHQTDLREYYPRVSMKPHCTPVIR